MLIDGEKWACEACVRGHRVSNCQHSDRPLSHINKKGRPVSQCAHCRTLRKSRSAHVKCDCGETKHTKSTCTHLKDGDKADTCCCSHGGRCSCSLKKEHLDPVPESDSDEPSPACNEKPRRPRIQTTQSDHGLTIFTNGHHKPAHKHNQMAHKCGLPYVVPRAHSIHGPSPSGLANRSVDNLPHTSTIDALHSDSHIKDSMISAQQEQRLIKSEHGSPQLLASNGDGQFTAQMPTLDLAANDEFSATEYFMPYESFNTMDNEQPIFSAGLSTTSVDWSHYDFTPEDFPPSTYSQAQSFNGFDYSSIDQPALTTTSTSGEISEVEDFGSIADPGSAGCPVLNKQFGSEASDLGDHDGYRLSTTSSYIGLKHQLQSNNLHNMESPLTTMEEFLKSVSTGNSGYASPIDDFVHGDDLKYLAQQDNTASSSNQDLAFSLPMNDDSEALWMSDFTTNCSSNQIGTSDTGDDNPWLQ